MAVTPGGANGSERANEPWSSIAIVEVAATERFPRDLRSPAQARHWARPSLAPLCSVEQLDGAMVVLSELVTNAVRHGCGEVLVTVTAGTNGIVIDVHDDSDVDVAPRQAEPWDPGGRGLHLVDGLSMSWGVNRGPDPGKSVWARLPCTIPVEAERP